MAKAITINLNNLTSTTPIAAQQSFVAEDVTLTLTLLSGSFTGTIVYTLRDRSNGTTLFAITATGSGSSVTVTIPSGDTLIEPDIYDFDVSRTDSPNNVCLCQGQWQLFPR